MLRIPVLRAIVAPLVVYEVLTGTRNVVLDPVYTLGERQHPDTYRYKYHEQLKELGLGMGETFYYEIVGFARPGESIMPNHVVTDKKAIQAWGSNIVEYSYGNDRSVGNNAMYVYRITSQTPDGKILEYSWPQVVARCKELGLNTVPHLETLIYDGNIDTFDAKCKALGDGKSVLDTRHIREGVCVRVESPELNETFKLKGWWFSLLEDIAKDDDAYVDPEEIS